MTAHLHPAKARPAEPSVIVIFGATGDLTRRLLLPALYNLASAKLLPDAFAVVGVARSQNSDAGFRGDVEHALAEFGTQKIKTEESRWLRDRSSYVSGNFDDPATYKRLADHVGKIEDQRGTVGNRIFYLAVPPGVVTRVTRN